MTSNLYFIIIQIILAKVFFSISVVKNYLIKQTDKNQDKILDFGNELEIISFGYSFVTKSEEKKFSLIKKFLT